MADRIFLDNPLYNFEDPTVFQNVVINPSISYLDTAKNDFQLTPNSDVLDIGDMDTALEIPFDILGISRTPSPDLGAYELNLP